MLPLTLLRHLGSPLWLQLLDLKVCSRVVCMQHWTSWFAVPGRASTKRRAESPTCHETELGGGSEEGLAEPWECTAFAENLHHLLAEPAFAPAETLQAHSAVTWMASWIWLLPLRDISREPLLSTHGQSKPFSLGKPLVTTDISYCRHSSGTQHQGNVLTCQG